MQPPTRDPGVPSLVTSEGHLPNVQCAAHPQVEVGTAHPRGRAHTQLPLQPPAVSQSTCGDAGSLRLS